MNGPERGTRLYHGTIRVFSAIFVLLGIAILIRTFSHGGGPLSLGLILGISMIAIGVARIWLTMRTDT